MNIAEAVGQLLEQREKNLKEITDLRIALQESLTLQSHYARLQNIYDGGKRITFDTIEDWMSRLREIGKLP